MSKSTEYHKLIILPALAGFLLFLFLMRYAHPTTYIPNIAENQEIVDESRGFLANSGFETGTLEPFVVFRTDESLLDEQISYFGKGSLNTFIKNGFLRFIPTWYFQVLWITSEQVEDAGLSMTGFLQPEGTPLFRTLHAPDGSVQRLYVDHEKGLDHLAETPSENQWNGSEEEIDLDMQMIEPGGLISDQPQADFLKSLLKGTVWDTSLMTADSLYSRQLHGTEVRSIRMTPQTKIFDHIPVIIITYSDNGQIFEIDQNVRISGFDGINHPEYADFIRALFYIFGVLLLLTIFFRRLFHRLIDVRASTTYASLAAGLVLFHIAYLLVQDTAMFQMDQPVMSVISFLFILLFLSALAGGMVFLLSGLGESLTREVWPEKIISISLVRLGYFKSKHVGNALVTGISAAFIYLGLAAVMYTLLDRSFLNPLDEQFFYTESYLFSTWQVGISGLFWMFIISAGLYASLLSWLALNFKSRVLILLAGGIGLSLMTSFYVSTPGSPLIFFFWFIPGLAITYIYLKYDLLSLIISIFFFFTVWATTDGLIVAGSPDFLLAWSIPGLMMLLLAIGWYISEYGNKNDHIAELTPAYIREIAREQRVERELEIAHQVHQSFLPVNLPVIPGIDIAAHCRAAFDVGGDYYDVIKVDEHRIAFVIGDVSGKGIQAAFFMTMVKGIVQSLVKEIPEPIPLLTRINRLFYDNARRGSFISICYALADVRNGTIRYARAGHNPGILIRSGEKQVSMIRSHGIAIGLTRNATFEREITEEKLTMNPGDGLIFYTDGVTEAVNTGNEMFGDKRLLAVAKENLQLFPALLLEKLDESVNRFTGGKALDDDMTLLIIRYTGESDNNTKTEKGLLQ